VGQQVKDKQTILAEIRDALAFGIISRTDLLELTRTPLDAAVPPAENAATTPGTKKPDKLSAVDVMFYIAGIVLFSAIISVINQSWDNSGAFVHILLSAGIGAGLWSLAYYLIRSPRQSDIRKGLINALLLTGSLLMITGGYIVSNQLTGSFERIDFIPGAIMLAVVGALHIGFDRLIKRDLTLLMGLLLCVAAFPALIAGIIQDSNPPVDAWVAIVIIAAGLLAYASRVTVKVLPERTNIRTSFDAFAAFVALASMYAGSFTDYGVFWLCALIVAVFGIFYLSIISQNRHLLGNASFFLVLTVITICFKYFSGFGITTSLILAAVGLLVSAATAATINKKYFKKT
jgi:uncharacterized membrane-anchored protein